jgi:hypothetical protein
MLFSDLNHGLLRPPGNDNNNIIIISDSEEEEVRKDDRAKPLLCHLLLGFPWPHPPPPPPPMTHPMWCKMIVVMMTHLIGCKMIVVTVGMSRDALGYHVKGVNCRGGMH